MKKILVISDTHGNRELLEMILDKNQAAHSDVIIHLGDNYEDIYKAKNLPKQSKIYRVPGLFHPGYVSGSLNIVEKMDIEGFGFLFAHRLEDLLKYGSYEKINLFGHSHRPEIFARDDKIFLNPGHLKRIKDRGHPASFAVITIDENRIDIKIIDWKDNIIKEYTEETNVDRRN